MLLVNTREQLTPLREQWRNERLTTALVPTMGNLHAGHLSLCEQARLHADRVIVSIFVNPTQFGPSEDFASYPRTLNADLDALREAGAADVVFAPAVGEIYPHGSEQALRVSLPELSRQLCGASRPGHFDGVAGVVLRLLNITDPELMLLGEKDFQQLVLMRWLIADLCLRHHVRGLPIHRADDGLALSSRNRYLTTDERERAPALFRELSALALHLADGKRDYSALQERAARALSAHGFDVDYVAVRDATDLSSPDADSSAGDLIVLGAAKLGRARLIDNVRVA